MCKTYICPGQCENCRYNNTNTPICWMLKSGEKVLFRPHGAGLNPEAGKRAIKRYFDNIRKAMAELKDIDLEKTVNHVRNTSNRKTGDIPTINQPAMMTCAACTRCAGGCAETGMCYAIHGQLAFYPSVRARVKNFLLFKKHPDIFFKLALDDTKNYKLARWHDSGDIVNIEYLTGMVKTARLNSGTVYLAMTKQLAILNRYCDNNGGREAIPENLQILVSTWDNFDAAENRYNFPTTGLLAEAD